MRKALLILPLMLLAHWANAAVINASGIIETIDADEDGNVDDLSIAHVTFDVEYEGVVTIDTDVEGFDSYLYLFNDTGSKLFENDDESPSNIDSYLSVNLSPGSYIAALGPLGTIASDAWQGYEQDWLYSYVNLPGTSDEYGMWSMTITTPVPIPAALPLFLSALLGMVGLARRR